MIRNCVPYRINFKRICVSYILGLSLCMLDFIKLLCVPYRINFKRICVSYPIGGYSNYCVSYSKKLIVFAILIMPLAHAEKPAGYLWYNLPKEAKKEIRQKPKGVPFSQLSYTDRDAVLHFYTMEALHKVRFTHKLEDERNFLALQNYWLQEAQLHGKINQKALIAYPQYDYSVTHPTSYIGIKIHDSLEAQKKKEALSIMSQNEGFIFYYRGKSILDVRQIPILQAFCKEYGFNMIGVSVDGAVAENLPDSRIDRGEADAMNVHYFPAVLLVNPRTKHVTPVSYGLTTQDILVEHLWAIYQNFQGDVHV